MTDRTDRRRPSPTTPERAEVPDDDLEAAYAELEAPPEPSPKERREEFRAARMALVDAYCAASGGTLDHTAFNKVRIDEFDHIAAEHGIRPWGELRDENRALREALGAELVGRHRHVSAEDLADVLDPGKRFDLDAALGRAAEVSAQRSAGARDLLVTAMQEMGIDTSAEDFDIAAVLQRAAGPVPESPELPGGHYVSTPESRSANLPPGRGLGGLDGSWAQDDPDADGVTGVDRIALQAGKDWASGKLR